MRHTILLALTATCVLLGSGLTRPLLAGPRIIEVDDGSGEPKPAQPPPAPTRPQPPPSSSAEQGGEGGVVLGAEQRHEPPGYHAHDGLFLRFLSVVDVWTAMQDDVELTAVGVPIVSGSLELGAALTENFILAVEGFFHSGPAIGLTVDGVTNDDVEGELFGAGFGLGMSWYFMPSNLYVTGSLGIAAVHYGNTAADATDNYAYDGSASGNSERGFYLGAKVGYEWWVSANWGLGVAGRIIYMNLPDDLETLHNLGVGFGLSATLN